MKTLDLYITNICNLNCEYCYVDLKTTEDGFEYEPFIERVNLLEYNHIKFFGGEPLLKRNEILNIVKLLEDTEIKFTIVTNGLLLTKDKVLYCMKNNIEIVISMHYKSIKTMLQKVTKFIFANRIIGFSFIFEDTRIKTPFKIVKFLETLGFTNFIFTPEVYGDWNDIKLKLLEQELDNLLKLYKYNSKIKFTGPSTNKLVKLRKGCTKNIYTKKGERKICNRFKSIEKLNGSVIKDVYKDFNEIIDYDNNPDKWFFVCPIGWYLDTLYLGGNRKERIHQYLKLNNVFLKFYKDINNFNGKLNFLTEKIDEIRFNLTSQCNIRCEYCYVDFKNEKLDFFEAKNIIDYFVLREGNNKTISFFGGEPLLEFDLLKKIVEYAKTKFGEKHEKIKFKIATNFLLISQEKMNFLKENNFEIHISFNGRPQINDKMRDYSTNLLLKNIDKYLREDYMDKVTILLAFSNKEINNLYSNIDYIYRLGFTNINLEMIFGKKYNWSKCDFLKLIKEFKKIKVSFIFNFLKFNHMNLNKNILDIQVDGSCLDNSLENYGYDADFNKQKIFKKLLVSYLY